MELIVIPQYTIEVAFDYTPNNKHFSGNAALRYMQKVVPRRIDEVLYISGYHDEI